MLFNTAEKTYHPIFYFESPFLYSGGNDLVRFKSKGHRTTGFTNRQDALDSIQTELIDRLKETFAIYTELDGNLEWDGVGIPADIQIRDLEWVNKMKSI